MVVSSCPKDRLCSLVRPVQALRRSQHCPLVDSPARQACLLEGQGTSLQREGPSLSSSPGARKRLPQSGSQCQGTRDRTRDALPPLAFLTASGVGVYTHVRVRWCACAVCEVKCDCMHLSVHKCVWGHETVHASGCAHARMHCAIMCFCALRARMHLHVCWGEEPWEGTQGSEVFFGAPLPPVYRARSEPLRGRGGDR